MATNTFDVLIVYSKHLARSADFLSDNVAPFGKVTRDAYNVVYGYFLKICQKNNLKAAFTTSADIIGAGKCKSYWLFENNTWIKVKKTGYSNLIFDKFSPTSLEGRASRNLLFSSPAIKPFNPPYLFNLFFDKQKTYKKLHKFSIPTVTIKNSTKRGIEKACKTLKSLIEKHPHKKDFSDDLVMKDRFGCGGRNVYKFKVDQQKDMLASMKKKKKKMSFIIQPFANFDKGFSYQDTFVSTDIRLIYLGGTIIQTYIRMAKTGEFRCNEHQGGLLKYIPKSQMPLDVVTKSRQVVDALFASKNSLFALDFIISNNGNIFLLEGNTGPGLDWNLSSKENGIEAQKLIGLIVKKLVTRVEIGKYPAVVVQ